MSYTIQVSESGDYILIEVQGDVSSEIAMKYTIESHQIGKELGILNFLVDLRNSKNLQMVGDNYSFVNQDLSKTPEIDRRAKVACVVSPDDHSHDFIETLSRNSGYNVMLFRDFDEAVNHLRST